MENYITKKFNTTEDIDLWLNDFAVWSKQAYGTYEIIYYIAAMDKIVITVRTWESAYTSHDKEN